MSKRILAVGNGDELLEQVNGRVYRHVYDERSGWYITIQEDGASAYAARLRKTGAVVNVPTLGEVMADIHVEAVSVEQADYDATMNAASNRFGY